MLEQEPMREQVAAADPLQHAESHSMIEKRPQVQWQHVVSMQEQAQDVVAHDVVAPGEEQWHAHEIEKRGEAERKIGSGDGPRVVVRYSPPRRPAVNPMMNTEVRAPATTTAFFNVMRIPSFGRDFPASAVRDQPAKTKTPQPIMPPIAAALSSRSRMSTESPCTRSTIRMITAMIAAATPPEIAAVRRAARHDQPRRSKVRMSRPIPRLRVCSRSTTMKTAKKTPASIGVSIDPK